jgi:hypothetical protein
MALPHLVVEVHLSEVPEIVDAINRYAALRTACKELLAELYCPGSGPVLCPAGLVEHIRKITQALKAEEDA